MADRPSRFAVATLAAIAWLVAGNAPVHTAASVPRSNGIAGRDLVRPAVRGAIGGTPRPAQSGSIDGASVRRRH